MTAVTFIIDAHHAQPVTSVMVVRDGAVHPCEMLPLPFNGLKDMRSSKIGLRFSVEGGFHEYGGETISISPKQFIMISLAKLRVGARLIVEMRIPLEIPGGMFNEVRVAGVIICGCKLAGGNFGYQVEMEHH